MKTKTLSLELSKRLNDLCLLDNIETEYGYAEDLGEIKLFILELYQKDFISLKTLTESEAIEFIGIYNISFILIFLPYKKDFSRQDFKYTIQDVGYMNDLENKFTYGTEEEELNINVSFNGETQLEALENLITYLLDNNLLTK